MCGWENRHNVIQGSHYVLWLRLQANNRFIRSTTMRYDHTTETKEGFYLMLPLEMLKNSKAELESPILHRKTKSLCFTMFYFGKTTANSTQLFVLSFLDLTRANRNIIFDQAVNGSTGTLAWIKYQHELDNLPLAYAFRIRAASSNEIVSDIGIDDISITQGYCPGHDHGSTTTTVEPPSEKKFDCDFESDHCNWKYDSNWKRTDYRERL